MAGGRVRLGKLITLSRPMIVLDTAGSGRRLVGATFPDGLSGITTLAGACCGDVPSTVGAMAAAVSADVAAAALSCFAVPPREHAASKRIALT